MEDFRTCIHDDHWIDITENRIQKRFCAKCGYTQELLNGEYVEDMAWSMLHSYDGIEEDYYGTWREE